MLNWKWDLEIQHNPQELGEPYEIYFFLGAIPSSPSDWRYSNTLLFEPIASRAHNTIKEFRFLNSHLEHHYGKEVKDDDVIPHLHKDLSWRVKRRYGDKETIDNSKLKLLKVTLHGPDGQIPITLSE